METLKTLYPSWHAGTFYPTYEEWKLILPRWIGINHETFYPTYEEWKPSIKPIINTTTPTFYPTYEEWKP